MLHKIIGFVDIIAVLTVIASPILPTKLVLLAGSLLLFKGAFFALQRDVISILDVICGFLIIFLAFDVFSTVVLIIVVFFLLQKIFFTMI